MHAAVVQAATMPVLSLALPVAADPKPLGCALADALGQGGLAAEARALLCTILPSSTGLLQADTLQVGWVLGPLWGGKEDTDECLAHSPAGCFGAPIHLFTAGLRT